MLVPRGVSSRGCFVYTVSVYSQGDEKLLPDKIDGDSDCKPLFHFDCS